MNNNILDFQPKNLEDFGWSLFFQEHFQNLGISNSVPARVASQSKNSFRVYSEYGILTAEIAGKMLYKDSEENNFPAVGDWVAIKPLVSEKKALIYTTLPRKTKFSRKVAGERTKEQIVSANIDTVFIVSGLDGGRNFNLRRIERYLTLAWSSGAIPVIILNKVDLCADVEKLVGSVETIAPGTSVHPVSAKEHIGLDMLRIYLTKGSTVAFLGSSGVGKSSLINSLIGANKQEIAEVREDNRMGRHTTTMRELILLPNGGMVIDTPGMREIQMWAGEDDLNETFQDIEMLAKKCRFSDCSHGVESDCAVREAIDQGTLDISRLESYRKLQKELYYLASREEGSTRLYEKLKYKKIAKWSKELQNRL
jgi:ribosome biogenesis GTPase / thiamine phosphate phosphatase